MKFRGMALSLCLVLGCGCAEKAEKPQSGGAPENLPADLQTMQGGWIAASTNECSSCDLNFTGYKMRLLYQKTVDNPVFKENISFASIDEQRKMLVEHDNTGGVKYNILTTDEGTLLEIEFFNHATDKWVSVCLKRG